MEKKLLVVTAILMAVQVKSQKLDNSLQSNNTSKPVIQEVEVILTGGSIPSEGNVYAVNSENEFGPVCDDFWGDADARVVCRQLGYEDGIATTNSKFGKVPQDFSINEVKCNGNESRIQDCSYRTRSNVAQILRWFGIRVEGRSYCGGHEGAGVICINSNVSVLLTGGSALSQGNVYAVNSENKLGPVCDDDWGDADAKVVCRQLGYVDGIATIESEFGKVHYNFAMGEVNCKGDEACIQDCSYRTHKVSSRLEEYPVGMMRFKLLDIVSENNDSFLDHKNCNDGHGAGVYCIKVNFNASDTFQTVKLIGGSTPSQGNIYAVNSANKLSPVCDDNWGDTDATVVCRQLGYLHGVATRDSYFGPVHNDFSMDDVNCNGDEKRIRDCPHNSQDDCDYKEGAGVICSNVTSTEPAGKCECNGVTLDMDKADFIYRGYADHYDYGDFTSGIMTVTVGECKARFKWPHTANFCFVSADSPCLDKMRTPTFVNPENKDAKFFSKMACYPQQVTDGVPSCPEDSTLCGDSCIPPIQGAGNDTDLYCCTGATSKVMRMDQVCNGTCGISSPGRFPQRAWRRSLCGTTSPACILSAMEGSSDVYCCFGQTIEKHELCRGCDYTSLPCKPDNSTHCVHIHKWCDGINDCPDGDDEMEKTCRSHDMLQRSCGRRDMGETALSRCEERVGQCFIFSPIIAGHRCFDRKDKVIINNHSLATPSPPVIPNFCVRRDGWVGVKCGETCEPYTGWCKSRREPCRLSNETVNTSEVRMCTTIRGARTSGYQAHIRSARSGANRVGDNVNVWYPGDGKTFCQRVQNLNYTMCDDDTRCFHESLRCDGRVQCLDGSDELNCRCPVATRPREQREHQTETDFYVHNYNKKEATFACRSKHGTDICSIRCDGVKECANALDEKGCELPTYYLVYLILSALLAISITLAEFGKYFQPEKPKTSIMKTLQITEKLLDLLKVEQLTFQQKKEIGRLIKVHHRRQDFTKRLELISAVISMNPDREMVKRGTKALYEGILRTHNNSRRRAFMCIKKHVRNAEFLEAIQDAENPGFFRTLVPKNLKTWFHQLSVKYPMTLYFTFTITSLIKIIFYLLDLVKDVMAVYLVAAVTFTLHGQENDRETAWQTAPVNFTDYHVQLLIVLILSVMIPLVFNAFVTSRRHPAAALGMLVEGLKISKSTLGLLTVLSWLLCIPTQVVVLWRLTRTQLEITRLKVGLQTDPSRKNIINILTLQQEEQSWGEILLQHKKTDVCVEVSVQSIVDILMLLLIKGSSRSKQVFGLEELFKGNNWFFYFALFVTIKKLVITNLNLIQSKKGFLGFKGKMILGLQYLLSGCIRIISIVAFFGGPLGLFDILIGFQPEPPFAEPLSGSYIPLDKSSLDSMPIFSLTVVDVTFFPLSHYYTAFIIFVMVHSIIIFGLKQFYSPSFRRSPRWSEKILNVIHNFAFIEELEDFDEDPHAVTKGELKRRYKDTEEEKVRIMAVFLIENCLLCLPLTFSCHAMANFYGELAVKTSLLPEEIEAYSTCKTLVWLPVIVGAVNILTIPLSLAYYKMGHPWKVLVNSFDDMDDDNIDYCQQLNEEDFLDDMPSSGCRTEEGEHINATEMLTPSVMEIKETDIENASEKECWDEDNTDFYRQLGKANFTAKLWTSISDIAQGQHIDATEMVSISVIEENVQEDAVKKESPDDHNTDLSEKLENLYFIADLLTSHSETDKGEHIPAKDMVSLSVTEQNFVEDAPEKESLVEHNTEFYEKLNVEDFTADLLTTGSDTGEAQHVDNAEMTCRSSQDEGTAGMISQEEDTAEMTSHKEETSRMTSNEEGMAQITSQEDGMAGMSSQKEGTAGMNSQEKVTTGMTNQEEGLARITNQEEGISGVTSKEGLAIQEEEMFGMSSQEYRTGQMISHEEETTLWPSEGEEMAGMNGQKKRMARMTSQEKRTAGMPNQEEGIAPMISHEEGAAGMTNHEIGMIRINSLNEFMAGMISEDEGTAGKTSQEEVPVGMDNQDKKMTSHENEAAQMTSQEEETAPITSQEEGIAGLTRQQEETVGMTYWDEGAVGRALE